MDVGEGRHMRFCLLSCSSLLVCVCAARTRSRPGTRRGDAFAQQGGGGGGKEEKMVVVVEGRGASLCNFEKLRDLCLFGDLNMRKDKDKRRKRTSENSRKQQKWNSALALPKKHVAPLPPSFTSIPAPSIRM
jgi:hypothetical protein